MMVIEVRICKHVILTVTVALFIVHSVHTEISSLPLLNSRS